MLTVLSVRIRLALALISTAIVGGICVRTAIVAGEAHRNLPLASAISPADPEVLRAAIMQGVTGAASSGTPIDTATAEQVHLLSRKAPLSPVPFSVEGAIALREGRALDAERLLLEARRRDPRDRGVRFLLADLFLRQGKVVAGLQELGALATLSPGVAQSIAEVLASYSRTPGAIPKLRQALQRHPEIEQALLSKLAEDAANVNLVLSLATPSHVQNDVLDWQRKLLYSLVNSGQFARAQDLWHTFSGRTEAPLGDFSDSKVTSPFTWSLLTSADGTARAIDGGLEVQFFGRADVALASRLLLLHPGEYDLRFRATSSDDATLLHWRVTCLPSGRALLDVAVAEPSDGTSSSRFTVPLGCAAQRITLQGLAAVYPSETDVTIAGLEVRRRG
ncbi:MAG TPA: hypothetical protein VFS41_05935 [Edaphobacter sp.]|nr:hypothetical protein [Edaphobacter sp.]